MEFSDSLDQLIRKSGSNIKIDCVRLGQNSYSLILNGKSYYITLNSHFQGYEIMVDHHSQIVKVQNELDILLEKFGMKKDIDIQLGEIHAQIPGLISQIFVKEGDDIESNQKLFILEAMKMENELTAKTNGEISEIKVKEGDTVDTGMLLMVIKKDD